MGKLSSILLGTVSGVAVALFLTSEKGKRVTSRAQDFIEDLKEDPEYAKEQVCEKLTDVKDQTKEFVLKTKEQIESGEITLDTVLDKAKYHAQQATEASKVTLNSLKEQLEEKVVVEDPEDGQEIIIEIIVKIILKVFQIIRGKEAIYCICDCCNCCHSTDHCQYPKNCLGSFLFFLFVNQIVQLCCCNKLINFTHIPRPFPCPLQVSLLYIIITLVLQYYYTFIL